MSARMQGQRAEYDFALCHAGQPIREMTLHAASLLQVQRNVEKILCSRHMRAARAPMHALNPVPKKGVLTLTPSALET